MTTNVHVSLSASNSSVFIHPLHIVSSNLSPHRFSIPSPFRPSLSDSQSNQCGNLPFHSDTLPGAYRRFCAHQPEEKTLGITVRSSLHYFPWRVFLRSTTRRGEPEPQPAAHARNMRQIIMDQMFWIQNYWLCGFGFFASSGEKGPSSRSPCRAWYAAKKAALSARRASNTSSNRPPASISKA